MPRSMNPQLVGRSCKGLRPMASPRLSWALAREVEDSAVRSIPESTMLNINNIAYILIDTYIGKSIDNINGM